MSSDPQRTIDSRIDALDAKSLYDRLRRAARELRPECVMDDLEVKHLTRVITECSLLLTDVYSEERITRIMHPERGFLSHLVDRLIDEQRRGEGEALYRVRRLPDDVRVVGDKALFDCGLLGLQRVKGYDLVELGARAYRMAGEVLELLADDRRLRLFFEENRLLRLPLEEEVVFLRQCADRFRVHAGILKKSQNGPREHASADEPAGDLGLFVETATAVAAEPALEMPKPVREAYLHAARGEGDPIAGHSRDHAISAYERILLFSALSAEDLQAALEQTVIDQQQAVATLCDELSLFAAGTRDLSKPPAYFLVGPTGVGKNYLVESLCRLLEGIWGIEVPTLTIEGPNYTYPSDINELRGATRGFIRSDEEGLLTTFHERSSRSPFSVLLIDEVEKAHAQLLTFFLSILDRGTTTDNRGDILDFSNCMLFFTSNLGYSDAQQRSSQIGYMDEQTRTEATDSDIRRNLRLALKPEFVNRVRMVHFNRLTHSSAERIFDLEFGRIARRYLDVHGLRIDLDAGARGELIRRGFSPTFGARHLAATLEAVCNVEIAKKVRRDDRSCEADRGAVVDWLREMRSGERPYRPDEVREKVLGLARASLEYQAVRVTWDGEQFDYLPVSDE